MPFSWQAANEQFLNTCREKRENLIRETEAFCPVTPTGTVYYLSSEGNDAKSGKSPAQAWKTCAKLKDVLQSGDTVLFACGSIFRESVPTVNGVTYASYGSGAKPRFYGSIDASKKEDWEQIGAHLYRYREEIDQYDDIGNLVFNGGEAWGIKIQKCTDGEFSLALENVSTGKDFFKKVESYPFRDGNDLSDRYDLSYFHGEDNRLYLISLAGNPGEVFREVELARSVKIFMASKVEDITICNLHFSNIGCFAIRTAGCKNLTVRNCKFEFIGGAIQFGYIAPWRNYRTRYGNGIENWGACDGMTVEHCFFSQIYDAAVTTQSNGEKDDMTRLTYHGNVFENCEYGYELWSGSWDCLFASVSVRENICTGIGAGLCSQRPDRGPESFFNSKGGYLMQDCAVEENLIWGSVGSLMRCNQIHNGSYDRGYRFDHNIYIHEVGKTMGLLSEDYPIHSSKLKAYPYDRETVEKISAAGFEEHGQFYYL